MVGVIGRQIYLYIIRMWPGVEGLPPLRHGGGDLYLSLKETGHAKRRI